MEQSFCLERVSSAAEIDEELGKDLSFQGPGLLAELGPAGAGGCGHDATKRKRVVLVVRVGVLWKVLSSCLCIMKCKLLGIGPVRNDLRLFMCLQRIHRFSQIYYEVQASICMIFKTALDYRYS